MHNGNNGNNDIDNQKYDNNSKKFAFLAQQTIPDYRPQQINDKNQKTSTNQSTKFHQLQAIFGHQGANIKDIANLQHNLMNSRNSSLENLNLINSENEVSQVDCVLYEVTLSFCGQLFIEKSHVLCILIRKQLHLLQLFKIKIWMNVSMFLIFQLRKAFTLQTEEINNLKNQLTSSEQRIKELESELNRLQLQLNRK